MAGREAPPTDEERHACPNTELACVVDRFRPITFWPLHGGSFTRIPSGVGQELARSQGQWETCKG